MGTARLHEHLGFGVFGPVSEFAGVGLSFFDVQMRSWFDDHMYDLGMRGHSPDRGYDELLLSYDAQADPLD